MSILDRATIAQIPWAGDLVEVIGLAAGTQLYRVFRHTSMDWEPPPEQFRTGRLDPPAGYKIQFATLYTAESLLTSIFEVRAVRMEPRAGGDELVIAQDLDPQLPPRQWVCHTLSTGAFFVNFEHRATAKMFGLDPDAILDRIGSWQSASKAVFDRLETSAPQGVVPVVGVAHQSKLRGSNGWNFGLFIGHHQTVLQRGTPQALDLAQVLAAHPGTHA